LPTALQQADRILLVRGRLALALGDFSLVEKVLAHDFAVIREGESELTDLWLELCLKRVSQQTGQPVDDALRQQVAQVYPPPARIDFRIFSNGNRDM
jgi:hypothetical protein